MIVALAQQDYIIGDFEGNLQKHLQALRQARQAGARLVVFPELSVCGYPPRDFLEFDDFIRKSEESVNLIASECYDLAAVVGAPEKNTTGRGKPLFNAAFFLHQGQVKAIQRKSLLPNYDIFDEYRYFEPNREFLVVEYEGKRIALTVCEDLWNTDEHPLYIENPLDRLLPYKPDLLINIAASPFHDRQPEIRRRVLTENARRAGVPLIYVNHCGAQTELIFDGDSQVLDGHGRVCAHLPFFRESLQIVDLNHLSPAPETTLPQRITLIHDALVTGIKAYFRKLNLSKAILGLSGGIDSAVVLVLAAEALGPENVRAVLLPSRYSTSHSVDDALALAKNLGVAHDIISIEDAFRAFEHTLQPLFQGLSPDLTEENLQARIRAVILMALSNKFGYILLNTSNKSEAAVGYGTLYGDMCGGLSVLGDVYKTDVYALARYLNHKREIIPENILLKAPSAELRPDQKDSDSLPEYHQLDPVLFEYIENRLGPEEIIAKGYDPALVRRVLRLVNMNEYKRHQTPPILRVSAKAFGSGRRMPIVGKYLA
ncbi:MAG: NAD+ synthase [Bacteroidales bacterium]